ncbi:MAG: cytochrome c maturation protein CcmE [Myxococcota bacterium]|nr:cytochrome c maturation protein CcmE [Myxococcota bacterium]
MSQTARPKRKLVHFAFPLFVVALVLGGLTLVVQSSTQGGVYDMTIGELRAKADRYVGKDVRVNGTVQAGSFEELAGDGAVNIRFTLSDSEGNEITVFYHQLLPDAFEEGREVIVAGTLEDEATIECKRLTVKCPSKYKDENAAGNGSLTGEVPEGTPATKPAGY